MKSKRSKQSSNELCAFCREKREKSEAVGVSLLLVTVVGCGLPGIVTIPLMIYFVFRAARLCNKCRKAKREAKNKSRNLPELDS